MLDLTHKRVLITGAHGFLGQHVQKRFARKCQLITPSSLELELLDRAAIDSFLALYRPHVVVHLAAQCGGIGINSRKPGEFLYNNLLMTTQFIDACHEADVEKFVGLGSVCSYPKYTPVPFKEDDLYNGYPEETNAPYGLAKRMQLEQLKAYRKQYGFNGIFLVPVNMAGEYDHFDEASSHVIPAMIKKFHDAKVKEQGAVELWGDGSPSREFLYAGDCADAIYKATIHYDGDEPVNIGTGHEVTMRELAQIVGDVVNVPGLVVNWNADKPNGQPRRCLDVSRAKEYFGFEAQTELEEIVRRAYEYYKSEVV